MKKYIVYFMGLFFIVHAHAMQNENGSCAVSDDRKRGAIINFYEDHGRQAHVTVYSMFRDKKVEILELPLPKEWTIITEMDFSIQRTHLIVRGIYCDEGETQRECMVIPLNIAEEYWESVKRRKKLKRALIQESPENKIKRTA